MASHPHSGSGAAPPSASIRNSTTTPLLKCGAPSSAPSKSIPITATASTLGSPMSSDTYSHPTSSAKRSSIVNKSAATKNVPAPPILAPLQVITPLNRAPPLAQSGSATAARVLGLATTGTSRLLVKTRGEGFDGMLLRPAFRGCLSTRPFVKNVTKLIMPLCNAPANVDVRAWPTPVLCPLHPAPPRHPPRRPALLLARAVPAPSRTLTFLTPLLRTPSPLPEAPRPSLCPPLLPRPLFAPPSET